MSDMSAYLGDALLNWLKSTAFPSDPAAVYASLWNGNPSSGGTEVTGTVGLTRQAVTFGSIAARAMANSAEVDFGDASGTATVTYVGLHDDPTAGNLLAQKTVTSVGVDIGEKVAIAVGDLDVSY
jgi:hypothetical protein